MAVQTTNATATVNPFTVSGDTFIVPTGIYIAVVNFAAVFNGNFSGTIINSGTIESNYTGIVIGSPVATDVDTLLNYGTVIGKSAAYVGYDCVDQITNVGTMIGSVFALGGNDALYNFGHIYGNIDMGSGDDTVYTHLSDVGPYTLTGGVGSDTLVNLDTFGTDSVNLSALSFESYYGQGANDYVWAGASTLDTVFVGGAGNDAFVGGSGNDFVVGGVGADYLDGGAGFNSIGYGGSATGVTVNLFTGTGSGGDAQGDTFFNFQGVAGSDNADNIYGNNGVNYLSGGGGNDLIVGYGGNDILVGGAGNDIFYYTGVGYGHDEITDFTIGQDVIYVSTSIAANFAALSLTQVGANTLITTGADSIQLDNITVASLHASDFIFF